MRSWSLGFIISQINCECVKWLVLLLQDALLLPGFMRRYPIRKLSQPVFVGNGCQQNAQTGELPLNPFARGPPRVRDTQSINFLQCTAVSYQVPLACKKRRQKVPLRKPQAACSKQVSKQAHDRFLVCVSFVSPRYEKFLPHCNSRMIFRDSSSITDCWILAVCCLQLKPLCIHISHGATISNFLYFRVRRV